MTEIYEIQEDLMDDIFIVYRKGEPVAEFKTYYAAEHYIFTKSQKENNENDNLQSSQ